MHGFRYDAHPMGMLMASVGALSTFYPDARYIDDPANRHMQIVRMIAKMPTLGAWLFRHAQGKPFVYSDNDLGYTDNFLSLFFNKNHKTFESDAHLDLTSVYTLILSSGHTPRYQHNQIGKK